jgi:hypothetical protein
MKTRIAISWGLIGVMVALASVPPAHGQDSVQGRVIASRLNVRAAPGTGSVSLGQFAYGTVVTVTGREDDPHDDGLWLFAESTTDGLAGWVLSDYVDLPAGFDLAALPLLEPGEAPAAAPSTAEDAAPAVSPVTAVGVPAGAPAGVPAGVIPTISPEMRQVFLRGQQMGNRPDVFSKVGDSITHTVEFLYEIGWGSTRLGEYRTLAPVIAHFSQTIARDHNSFANASLAARAGWISADLLNPAQADHTFCGPDEMPLVCEYARVKPAVALIMIGTNDISHSVDPATYRANLEQIVQISLDWGVIPVLSTIPDIRSAPIFGERVHEFNAIIREVAAIHGLPLWDYWLALQDLPNKGLGPDDYHPSGDPDTGSTVIFTPEGLTHGFTMRNLTALLVLDAVWHGAMY